jgi:hypothetical protein
LGVEPNFIRVKHLDDAGQALQLPDTDTALEKMLIVNVAQNIRQETARRAGFNSSGVSRNSRLVERHDSTYGMYWKSYDFAGNVGRQNLFEHPLGPSGMLRPGLSIEPFEAAEGELIFSLPNGLQGYLLVDETGRRIERGPTQIVSDPKQGDRTVVNGISCMSCHYAGIIQKTDEIREHILLNRDAFPEADEILALYGPSEEMSRLMNEDAERFRHAVEATGSTVSKDGEPVVNMSRRFEEDLDLRQAAAEVGMTSEESTSRIQQTPRLRRVFGQLMVAGGTAKREVFAKAFSDIVRTLDLGTPSGRQ